MLNDCKKIVKIIYCCVIIYFFREYIKASKVILDKTKKSKLKFEGYYNVESEWLHKKILGKKIETFFKRNDYNSIAIYGIGNLGKLLCDDLFESDVNIKYIIDNNVGKYRNIEIINKNSELEDVDVIVVTATFDFQEIKDYLSLKTDCKVISLFDVVWDE